MRLCSADEIAESPKSNELTDSRCNARFPPSDSEIHNRFPIVSREHEIVGTLSYGAGGNQLIDCFMHRQRQPWNIVFCFTRFKKNDPS